MQRISMLFAFLAAIGLCLLSTAQAYIVLSSDLDNPEQKIDPAVQLAAENLRDVQARVPELNHAKPDLNRYVVVTPGSKLASSFQPVTVAKSMPSLARRRLNLEAPINDAFSSSVFDRLPDYRESLIAQVPKLSPLVSKIDPNHEA